MKLEKGAKVKVRLHTGEVVEAVYYESCQFSRVGCRRKTDNYVFVNEVLCVASSRPCPAKINALACNRVRFVGNPCDLVVPVGVSDD